MRSKSCPYSTLNFRQGLGLHRLAPLTLPLFIGRDEMSLVLVLTSWYGIVALIKHRESKRKRDIKYMKLAINQAWLSKPVESAYCVGCVLVSNGQLISTGYSRELDGNTHAEQCALMKAPESIQEQYTELYTTMEPCSRRLSKNLPCVSRCIEWKINRVIIGAREPTHFVTCNGIELLEKAGIQVFILDDTISAECLRMNRHLN